jgi:hypothetical protein
MHGAVVQFIRLIEEKVKDNNVRYSGKKNAKANWQK